MLSAHDFVGGLGRVNAAQQCVVSQVLQRRFLLLVKEIRSFKPKARRLEQV